MMSERPSPHTRPRPRKRFGQHFLEAAWSDKLVEVIAPQPGDRFLEIGPGPGALTLRLASRVASITAIEVDRDLVPMLEARAPANVEVIAGDFLELDLSGVLPAHAVRVAGNLPYNLSSPILFRLLEMYKSGTPLVDATLMLQREVADRLGASPGTGEYGVLSVLVQLRAEVRRVLSLPPGAFRPPPKVHSAVVKLTFRPAAVPLRSERVFEDMVRSVFTQRRKTLGNALRPFAESRGADARGALADAGIDPARRPETLDLGEFGRLADSLTRSTGAA